MQRDIKCNGSLLVIGYDQELQIWLLVNENKVQLIENYRISDKPNYFLLNANHLYFISEGNLTCFQLDKMLAIYCNDTKYVFNCLIHKELPTGNIIC